MEDIPDNGLRRACTLANGHTIEVHISNAVILILGINLLAVDGTRTGFLFFRISGMGIILLKSMTSLLLYIL